MIQRLLKTLLAYIIYFTVCVLTNHQHMCMYILQIGSFNWGVVRQLTKAANFTATPIKKTYLAGYYLLAGDTSQVSVFFPDIKMSKQRT